MGAPESAVAAILTLVAVVSPAVSAAGQQTRARITRAAIVQAEDARAATSDELDLLVRAATTPDAALQAIAVRALGRLERPELTTTLLPLLEAKDPGVRAEAANALAQVVGKDAERVRVLRTRLFERLLSESSPEVRGAMGEAIGRLVYANPADALEAERALVEIASRVEVTRKTQTTTAGPQLMGLTIASTKEVAVPLPALVGALRGLESLARARGKAQPLAPETVARLRQIVLAIPEAASPRGKAAVAYAEAARARRLAWMCLLAGSATDADLAGKAQSDPDPQVRRLAVSSPTANLATVTKALGDAELLVRYDALRAYGRRFQPAEGCEPIVDAVGAVVDHVSLLAIDLLANPCRPEDHGAEILVDLAAGVTDASAARGSGAQAGGAAAGGVRLRGWHRPAHAIVALAKLSPERARPELRQFLSARPWQARMYAARAAAQLADVAALRALAGDEVANVREAAIAGLAKTVRHDADEIYIQALSASDYQLVITAAGALAGTPARAAAVPALLAALARLSAADSDTARDPRVAILERLRELATRDQAEALAPYVRDVDPRVAELAARIVTGWTGTAVTAAPRPRPPAPAGVTDADLARLEATTVAVTMEGGGRFELRLLADLAPMSCARFATLASRGYYNGLTFHRVLPNFLIQGGSPGANEFMGDSRYTRDELGRSSQLRGTVGISTRGRDTGDAQIYINLVDTPRLDHDYTIFAEVVRGMDVVDGILEGDVIQRVELRGPKSSTR
jgi:cyclophilin family peptidyl-prolyl cis-trans isomerase/HEAT repeat protein